MNRIDLEGRAAVVTGGAKGLGRAVARRLAASGATVSVWDADARALDDARAEGWHGLAVDVASLPDVERATRDTCGALGGIDILINNAGISGPIEMTWKYPVEDWRRVLEVDLFGVYHCCRTVIPQMVERGYGRIVNIASIAGKEGNPGASAYAAAKAGVIAMTKSLGKELVKTGVLVNAIAPAAFQTDILSQSTDEFVAYMLSKIPMGRLGQPDELGALAAWLASEDCSFSTGATYDISGGRATY